MTKEFIPYEQALAFEELEFDEPCLKIWEKTMLFTRLVNPEEFKRVVSERYTKAPTFSQAFRWFREKYGLRNRNYGSLNYSGTISEYFEIFQYAKGTSDKVLSIIVGSLTYEEAELECLKKLIEIVKNK